MKYRTLAAFDRDSTKLPREHQQMFRTALADHFLPAIEAGSFTGDPPWPSRLRVHRLAGTAIYSITWSFAGPDGRATFQLESGPQGEALLVWCRIGTHAVHDRPEARR